MIHCVATGFILSMTVLLPNSMIFSIFLTACLFTFLLLSTAARSLASGRVIAVRLLLQFPVVTTPFTLPFLFWAI